MSKKEWWQRGMRVYFRDKDKKRDPKKLQEELSKGTKKLQEERKKHTEEFWRDVEKIRKRMLIK